VNGDQTIDQAKQAHVINVRLANTARALLYQYVEPEDKVSVGLVSPQSLTVEGNDHARRLVFSVECYVYPQQGRALRIQGELTSDGWVPRGPLPPVGRMCAELVPTHNDDSEAELAYIFTLLKAPETVDIRLPWKRFLTPGDPDQPPVSDATDTFETALQQSLGRWLATRFRADTPEAAVKLACEGSLGQFGPVESRVLPRTGQADLAVDVTLLSKVSGQSEQDSGSGMPALSLALYGERFGYWLLHRHLEQPLKSAGKEAGSVPVRVTDQVIIADSAESLIEQAGLTDPEKRVFQLAGILPPATLWPASGSSHDEALAHSDVDGAECAISTAISLATVPDRPRRHLQSIVTMVQKGTLDPTDVDLLWRTARQLARAKR
jgi:hypothetical protein